MNVLRLKPDGKVSCDGHDLDSLVIEYADDGSALDFRFELGAGLMIYWALPAGRDDRLRLILVDSAVAEVGDPSVIQDPFAFDLPVATWVGELATLANGSTITSVIVEVTRQPAAYRCEVAIRAAAGGTERTRFAWSG